MPWSVAQPARTRSVSRLAHGAYDRPDQPVERWLAELAEACVFAPGAVVCLGTAAHFELLLPAPPCCPALLMAGGTCSGPSSGPHVRYIAARHEDELVVGVVEDVVLGVSVRRTSPARTVVDLARRCRGSSDERLVAKAGRCFLGMGGDLDEIFSFANRLRTPCRARELLERIGQAPARAAS